MTEQGEQLDVRCIGRFLAGDEPAYEELVVRYQRRIFNLALRYLRGEEEAREATQEIFIKVYRSLPKFRGDARFSTWLYQVAVNHCKNRLKYLQRRHYYNSESMDDPVESEDGETKRQYADQPDPRELTQSRETQELVRRAIDQLPDEHREAIVLRDLQGLSYEEIAAITGQVVGTVKSRIHRGRAELARLLQPWMEREGES
jgi:RNA polymerase sigma-70 factor (ECF subfamily)